METILVKYRFLVEKQCFHCLTQKFLYTIVTMASLLSTIHVIIAVLLIISIVLQTRSSGLSATFGGTGASNIVQRRGAEKLIFQSTVYLSTAFFVLAVLRWYIY